MSLLFGGSMLGLRSLATGLPAKFLLDPKKALADMATNACSIPSGAQYVIFATSGNGDPMSCNAPGCYDDPTSGVDFTNVAHPPNFAPATAGVTSLTLNGKPYTAAAPWSMLTSIPNNVGSVLGRTCFAHVMTNTPVHPKEPQVLQLMGTTLNAEMFPSVLAAQLAPCLNTLQVQPISVGAATPSEALTFQGQALPTIPPASLNATLANPTGELSDLQPLRDSTLNSLYTLYKTGTPAQQQYVDSVVTSQQQVRGILPMQLMALQSITANDVGSQINAAIALIQMGVSPVIAIHIPFGGDNHSDAGLTTEATQTIGTADGASTNVTGVAAIAYLLGQLGAAGLSDKVSFISLNVFGRTMLNRSGGGTVLDNSGGRQHNQCHQMSMMIGKPFNGCVIGGIGPVDTNCNPTTESAAFDYGAMPINPKTGVGDPTGMAGDIIQCTPSGTPTALASWAQTVMTGLGVPASVINTEITAGTVIQPALASS